MNGLPEVLVYQVSLAEHHLGEVMKMASSL